MPPTYELLGIDPNDAEVIAATQDYDELAALIRNLVEHRHRLGLSQEDVAERLGIKQPAVSAFERTAGNPSVHTIQRYARAIGLRLRMRATSSEQWMIQGLAPPTSTTPHVIPRHSAAHHFKAPISA